MRWAGHVAQMGEMRNVCNILVGKPFGKRPHGTPMHKLEDNIKQILAKLGWRGWTGSICFRIGTKACPCEHGDEPSGSIKGREFLD
jgi:hypothetical protein